MRTKDFRLVAPDGRVNILIKNRPEELWVDLYHDLIGMKWSRLLSLIFLSFLGTNLLFSSLYYSQEGSIVGSDGSFLSAFFFSVQTLSTIGYGVMSPGTMFANWLVSIEAMIGLVGLAMVAGLVFAKFSKPTARVMFSNKALVTQLNGKTVFKFRCANARGNEIVDARLNLTLVRTETSQEGIAMRRLIDLPLMRSSTPLFALSWTVAHIIDENSPLWELYESKKMGSGDIIIATLIGTDSTFNSTIHARVAYAADDVNFGGRFQDILKISDDGLREIDFDHFHEVLPK